MDVFTKADPDSPYRVDDRATLGDQFKPVSYNVNDGPTLLPNSGIRVNDDYPNPSGN